MSPKDLNRTESQLTAMADAVVRTETLWLLCGGHEGFHVHKYIEAPDARPALQHFEHASHELSQAKCLWQKSAAPTLMAWAKAGGFEPGSYIAVKTTGRRAPVVVYATVKEVSLYERSFLGVKVAAIHLEDIRLAEGVGSGLISQADANFHTSFINSGLVRRSKGGRSDFVLGSDVFYCPDTRGFVKRSYLLVPLQQHVRDDFENTGQLEVIGLEPGKLLAD